ncbi:hypothetical protein IWW52_005622, partial [Coemansia sp. RSA 2704]
MNRKFDRLDIDYEKSVSRTVVVGSRKEGSRMVEEDSRTVEEDSRKEGIHRAVGSRKEGS